MDFTLEKIERLQSNEVFMFGSHINGQHCSGVTRTAYECFGTVLGKGDGAKGRSYATPTIHGNSILLQLYADGFN